MSFLDHYLCLQEQLARSHDPLAERYRMFERLASPFEQIARSFRQDSLMASFDRELARTSAMDEIHRGLRGVSAMAELREQFGASREIARALETASAISQFSTELSRFRELPINELGKHVFDVGRTFETARLLGECFATTRPELGAHWLADLARGTEPWFSAHREIWPRDALLLRMLSGELAAASWIEPAEPIEPEGVAYFRLAALTDNRVEGGEPINIELDVRCALCGELLLVPTTDATWLGPRSTHVRIEVIPICATCTARDDEEPGYIRDAVIALFEDSAPETRPYLESVDREPDDDGSSIDPTPCGATFLRLVPAAADDNPEDDD